MALKAQQSFIEVFNNTVSPGAYAEIEEVNNITGPDGKAKLIDTTHLRSTGKEYLQGIPDFGQIALDLNFTGATQQIFLRNMYSSQSPAKPFRLRIPDDVTAFHHVFTFNAICTSWALDLKTDDKAGLKINLQISGGVTYEPPGASPLL